MMLGMRPIGFFAISITIFVCANACGLWIRRRWSGGVGRESGSLKTLESAVLALLGLLLGFTFSMAVSRYDTRKALEIEEANDIGTLWLRTSLLSDNGRVAEQALITYYVHARLDFFASGRSQERFVKSAEDTARLQQQMWDVAMQESNLRRDPESALFVSVLNDSIDVTEKRRAALENRIPAPAWVMLLGMGAIGCSLVALSFQGKTTGLQIMLPLILASTLTLIYDIDSPRSGLIRVQQQSMERLAQSVGVR